MDIKVPRSISSTPISFTSIPGLEDFCDLFLLLVVSLNDLN